MNDALSSAAVTLAAGSLGCYAAALWKDFEVANHHRLIVSALESLEKGNLRRLLICLPPRHGKTLLSSQLFPSWLLGRNPTRSVISCGYSQELSEDSGRRVRNFLLDTKHQAIFPDCRLSLDSSSVGRFATTRGGAYYAVGRGSAITGRGADFLICDDMLANSEEAHSPTIRKNLIEWYQSVAYPRLQPGGVICVIGTRWHEADLIGYLLKEQPGEWELLSLPAIAETDESFRKTGEPLWEQRYPLAVLQEIRRSIGSQAWTSLYQQRPSAAEGAVFRRDWWRTYREAPQFKRVILSLDTAFKTGATNDYTAATVWGVAPGGYYLLHCYRERVEFPALKRRLAQWADLWTPSAILIEDRASGQSLIQELKLGSRLPVLAIKADSDKVSRAQAVTPLIEAGKVFIPESAPWLADFIDELSAFPNGVHDDQCDSVTQALNHLRERTGGGLTFHKVLIGLPYSPFDF